MFRKLNFKDNTAYCEKFNDYYYSKYDDCCGTLESKHNFIEANKLINFFKNSQQKYILIGEIGFGLGINFITTVYYFLKNSSSDKKLYFYSCEKYPLSPSILDDFYFNLPKKFNKISRELINNYPSVDIGKFHIPLFNDRVVLLLSFEDALKTIKNEYQRKFDFWFLDGFSKKNNPDLWSNELLEEISIRSKYNTKLSSFSVDPNLCMNLKELGFTIHKIKGFAKKKESLLAIFNKKILPTKNNKISDVTIIGGGIAGFSIAYFLSLKNITLNLIDKEDSIAYHSPKFACIRPIFAKDKNDKLAKFSQLCFLFTSAIINKFNKINNNIILDNKVYVDYNDYYNQIIRLYPYSFLAKKDNLYQILKALIIRPKELISTLYQQIKRKISLQLATEITRITKYKGKFLIFDRYGNQVSQSTNLILANGIGLQSLKPNEYISSTYGKAHSFTSNHQNKSIDYKQLLTIYDNNELIINSISRESFLDCNKSLQNKIYNSNLNINFDYHKEIYRSMRLHSLDYLPIIGSSNDDGLFYHSSFGSKAMTYAMYTANLLAEIITKENLFFKQEVLDLSLNRFTKF